MDAMEGKKLEFPSYPARFLDSELYFRFILWLYFCINLLKPTVYVMHQQFNILEPTGYVMHQQFNIQQLYALPTLYLCVLYLSENKQRLVPLTA